MQNKYNLFITRSYFVIFYDFKKKKYILIFSVFANINLKPPLKNNWGVLETKI